jgi:hypothetical protein
LHARQGVPAGVSPRSSGLQQGAPQLSPNHFMERVLYHRRARDVADPCPTMAQARAAWLGPFGNVCVTFGPP